MANIISDQNIKETEINEDFKERNSLHSKPVPEKLIIFTPNARGYQQIEKEKKQGWTVKSIGAYEGNKEEYKGSFICILEQSENIKNPKEIYNLFSPKKKIEEKLEDA